MTDARSPMRALRAAMFAAVCTALAAVGHSFTSGHGLPPAVLLLAFALTAAAGWLAGGRRRGVPSIGAGLLAVQGSVHLLFAGARLRGAPPNTHDHTALGPDAMATDTMSTASMSADTMSLGTISADTMAASTMLHSSAGMLAGHLLAAAVCALWLARGEAAFFRLAEAIGTFAFTPLRLLLTAVRLPDTPRPRLRHPSGTARRRSVVLGHTLVRRGPPPCRASLATAPGAAV
ncbi:hypothetical protein [Streptomyces sp. NPDC020681]|uniref:hypothetical protein n=1 Tax=Streptomyces sp. NPDC020681 TaxID=3365083 RepID=UPI003793EF60